MAYLAFHFTVTPVQPGSEILIALLGEEGFESFDYTDAGFTAYGKEEEVAATDLLKFKHDDFSFTCKIDKIADTNWNAEWEKNFDPVVIPGLLCIRAPFHDVCKDVKHEIVIMPKMSFGTGHHQTTRLVCSEMFRLDLSNKRVLDMGCGTGILAILAGLLGAKDIVGIDIDEWSVENAIENCAMNHFPEISVLKGGVELLKEAGTFDVILANINKNILKAQLPAYSASLSKGGHLFLSGFFTTDVDELTQIAITHGFEFLHSAHENEWAMMLLKKI